MKQDTITITRAEYEQLNKAANAAVEHACELFKAARLVDELKARVAELEAERDELEDRVVDLEECVWDINGYAWVADTENAALEERLAKAKRKLENSVSLSAMNELENMFESVKEERDALEARIERVKLYGRNVSYAAKYRRGARAMGEESATNFILSILDGTHKD